MTALDLAAEGEEPSLQMNGMIEMPSKVEWNFISLFFFFQFYCTVGITCFQKCSALSFKKIYRDKIEPEFSNASGHSASANKIPKAMLQGKLLQ